MWTNTNFIGFYSAFSSSMCVQEEKKNELSNKSKQYPTNNKRFSSKVPRADWVSILNLKTRLSHVNFFIKGIVRVCGWFCTCPKYRHFFYLSEKSKVQLLVSNSERVIFDWCWYTTSKPYPSKEYKTVLHVHASNGIDLVWHYKKVSKTAPQDIFNFEQTTILVLFGYLFNSNTFDRLTK